ncbi:hypothetical protein F5Y04DRAFT_291670 [Hypomontagnella monticulosa]|nr:hypothetical protein F5Y04DRAFT_291670 [Hypomontagnella monticulosa]
MANPYEGINFWIYVPNKGAAVFFLIAFLISAWSATVSHYKFFKVTGLFMLAGLLYVVGFGLRLMGAFGNYDELVPFILSVALIYVSPPLLSLADYEILGRVFHYVPYLSPMDPARVLSTFGFLSLIIEGVNGVAASLIANPETNPQIGTGLMWTALVLQFIIIISFLALAGRFHWRCAQAGLARARAIRRPLIMMYVSVTLILVRTIYRGVEHSVAAVASIEWPFCVFEASLMLINMYMFNIWHPGRYMPVDIRTYLARDGVTELKAPERHDNRLVILKVLDPFHISEMCHGRDKSGDKVYQEFDEYGNELALSTPVGLHQTRRRVAEDEQQGLESHPRELV